MLSTSNLLKIFWKGKQILWWVEIFVNLYFFLDFKFLIRFEFFHFSTYHHSYIWRYLTLEKWIPTFLEANFKHFRLSAARDDKNNENCPTSFLVFGKKVAKFCLEPETVSKKINEIEWHCCIGYFIKF